jgi:hypothetical protein
MARHDGGAAVGAALVRFTFTACRVVPKNRPSGWQAYLDVVVAGINLRRSRGDIRVDCAHRRPRTG